MQTVVIVDSRTGRGEAWKEALEEAGYCVKLEYRFPRDRGGFSQWPRAATVLVHSHDLILDATEGRERNWFGQHGESLLNGQRTVVVFSGGVVKELDGGRLLQDDGVVLELPNGVHRVRRPLDNSDALDVVAAFRNHNPGSDPLGFVSSLEGKAWPESLVALYIVCSAILEVSEQSDVRDRMLDDGWGALVESAKEEAAARMLGELSFTRLTPDSVAQAAGEVRVCLERVMG